MYEALFFSASVQELGKRLPVITFGHVLAVMLCTCSAQTYNILLIDKPFQVVYCCQSGTTFTYLCECELIRPTNKVCLCGVKSNYYYNCELNILVDSIEVAMLIVERVHKWALAVLWQSRIEIGHCSA